jgi:Protein of unknown function (DUF2934)
MTGALAAGLQGRLLAGERGMTEFNDDDVRARAFQLWEEAGKPADKMDEFWYKAEQQLKEERIKHELKTPDNL